MTRPASAVIRSWCWRRQASCMSFSAAALMRGVTFGLPSRSPPIQEPKLSSGGTGMSWSGYVARIVASRSR